MFWTKALFFLVAMFAGGVAVLALVEGRPVQSELDTNLEARLQGAARATDMMLKIHARKWLDAVGHASSDTQLAEALAESTRAGDKATQLELVHKSAQARLRNFNMEWKTDQLLAVDGRGRVLARAGLDEESWRDDISGYPVVAEALRGYRLDDSWDRDGKIFHVSASPVISGDRYVGCLLVAQEVGSELATRIHDAVGVDVALLLGDKVAAQSTSLPILGELPALARKRAKPGTASSSTPLMRVNGGDRSYLVKATPLPGEAALHGAAVALVLERPMAPTAAGTFAALTPAMIDPREMAPFAGTLLGVLLLGFLFIYLEHDRPVRKLLKAAQALSRTDGDHLEERGHRGRIGATVRAFNATLARVRRAAEGASARPVSEGLATGPVHSGAPIELHAAPDLPAFAPTAASPPRTKSAPPAPSLSLSLDHIEAPELNDVGTPIGGNAAVSTGLATDRSGSSAVALEAPPTATTPLFVLDPGSAPIALMDAPRRQTPAPPALAVAEETTLDEKTREAGSLPLARLDEMTQLDAAPHRDPAPAHRESVAPPTARPASNALSTPPAAEAGEAEFPEVFREFVDTKLRCGEPVATLTYEKFAVKLRQNRDTLIARYACQRVKFSVYIKDGKAALKATPVH